MFFTKFMQAGVIDKDNKQALSEIELVERNCSDFELECREVEGKWGLWLNIGIGQLLVCPLGLVSSLYKDDCLFMDILVNGRRSRCEVSIRKTSHSFEWTILNIELSLYCVLHFKYVDYVGKSRIAMNGLLEIYNRGLTSAHKEPIEGARMHQAVEMCCKQLQIEALHPSHHRLMTDKVCQEEFVFCVVGDHEEHFRIGIGNRSYETWFSDWDNNLENIRHQLESLLLIYGKESEIDLNFDTSTTSVRVKFVSVLDGIEDMGKGYAFKYKEYALVKILPNEFVNMPIIAGYCDRKQFVRTMYEGLLSLALQYPIKGEYDNDEIISEAYNKIKSPSVEQYIKEEMRECHKAQPRDIRVKNVILINPDYYTFAQSLFEDCADYTVDADGTLDEDLYDNEGKPIVLRELYEWRQEIEPIVIASECGKPYKKDWVDYHRRGLEIAHKLRKVLSSDFDLWYKAPLEDKSGTIEGKILIL